MLLIENGNYYWLALSIFKGNELDTKITNLVLKPMGDNKLLPLIYSYNLTEEEKLLVKNNVAVPNLISKTTVSTISGRIMFDSGNYTGIIWTDANDNCYQIDHIWMQGDMLMIDFIRIDCPENSSGGSGDSGNGANGAIEGIDYYTYDNTNGVITTNNGEDFSSGGGTNTSTNSSNNNNPDNYQATEGHNAVVTSPLEEQEPEPEIDHIQFLNAITNRTEVKERLLQLKAETLTISTEQGTEYFTDYENPNEPLDFENTLPEYSRTRFGPVFPNSILRVHAHHSGLEPVFSCDDVVKSVEFYIDKVNIGAEDAINATSILVTNTVIYALAVTNTDKASIFYQSLRYSYSKKEALKVSYEKTIRRQAQLACNCTGATPEYDQFLIDYLIEFLINQNTGLTLYSATVNTDGTLTWAVTVP